MTSRKPWHHLDPPKRPSLPEKTPIEQVQEDQAKKAASNAIWNRVKSTT